MPEGTPTPNNMPGAQAGNATETDAPEGTTPEGEQQPELTAEELAADRDKWRDIARRNEARAKGNSEKAKEYDEHFEEYKAAWEAAQAAKSADQKAADAEAKAEKRAKEAEDRARAAELKALRLEHASDLPGFLHDLITGTDADEVQAQVADLKKELDAYIEALGAPRRPNPVPAAGRGGSTTASAEEQFAAAMSGLL